MLPVILVFLAAQASAPTPAPTATPTSTATAPAQTPTPVPAADPWRPRGLSDIAKERKLGRLTSAGATVVTTPEPEPAASASGTPAPHRNELVRVEDVQDNGAVTDGFVSIYGTVRNAGRTPVCHVRIFLRLYDDHGVLLSTGETTTDLKVVAPGDAVPFGGTVKAPAGLRGSSEPNPDPLARGGSATNWKRVGRVEAEVTGKSEECS